MKKPGNTVIQFKFDHQVKPTEKTKLCVVVIKHDSPTVYKFIIMNLTNSRRDDIFTIKTFRLPGTLSLSSDSTEFANQFQDKLKIIWTNKGGMMKIQDAFIDNSYIKEQIIHKIVEVKVHADGYKKHRKDIVDKQPETAAIAIIAKQREEGYMPRGKEIRKKRSGSEESETTNFSVNEEEYTLIKADVKEVKAILKLIRKKATALPNGVRGWYDHFD